MFSLCIVKNFILNLLYSSFSNYKNHSRRNNLDCVASIPLKKMILRIKKNGKVSIKQKNEELSHRNQKIKSIFIISWMKYITVATMVFNLI